MNKRIFIKIEVTEEEREIIRRQSNGDMTKHIKTLLLGHRDMKVVPTSVGTEKLTLPSGRVIDVDADGFEIKKEVHPEVNPFIGWVVEPDPDGGLTGWFSDEHKCKIKSITNGKRSVVLREDNPLYNQF